MEYKEVIHRLGYFRNRAKLSQREASLRLGYSPEFLRPIENQTVELKVSTLLDFCDVAGISIFDFFYLGEKYNPEHQQYLDLFRALPDHKKDAVITMLKSLQA
ncbi:MAG: helix-turn-helix domain-containing protein [Prevotella sp.]|nr:helix-turn-helix domain-containing protein [Prevotella sp.]